MLLLWSFLYEVCVMPFYDGKVCPFKDHGITGLFYMENVLIVGLSKSKAYFSGMKFFGGPWVFFVTFSFFSSFGFYALT